MREPLDVIDAIFSTRAMRYLKPDPIPDDALWAILDAAIRGPSGGNRQAWGWVVVRDAETKRRIAAWYREGWAASYGHDREEQLRNAALGPANYLSAEHLAQHIEEAPVWVFPVLRGLDWTWMGVGSSVYGAVQNLMLAARAYGIGSTLTTMYRSHEDDVRRLLGIPDDARTMCLIPLGYPARGSFSTPRRQPVDEVVHWDTWGTQRPRPSAPTA